FYRYATEHNRLPKKISRSLGFILNRLMATQLFIKYSHTLLSDDTRCIFYQSYMDSIKEYLETERPDCLIMAEANVEYLSQAYVKIFHEADVPVIVAPDTFCTPAEPALFYYNKPLHRHRLFQNQYLEKRWIYTHEGRDLIRMPVHNISAMKILNIT